MLELDTTLKVKLINFVLRFKSISRPDGLILRKGSVVRCKAFIGRGTRANGKIVFKGARKVILGNYCAFGDGVRIITSNHGIFGLNLQHKLQLDICQTAHQIAEKDVIIGHNVWVGDSVIILPGVSIGNGAIIGAGSVVAKNIESYSVHAGVPSKFIKKRFSDDIIELIEKLSWWDWSLDKMKKHRELFEKQSIEKADLERALKHQETEG